MKIVLNAGRSREAENQGKKTDGYFLAVWCHQQADKSPAIKPLEDGTEEKEQDKIRQGSPSVLSIISPSSLPFFGCPSFHHNRLTEMFNLGELCPCSTVIY